MLRIVRLAMLGLAFLAVLELCCRLAFGLMAGTRALLHGFRGSVESRQGGIERVLGGLDRRADTVKEAGRSYYKLPPGAVGRYMTKGSRREPDGTRFKSVANNFGFRGGDFFLAKPPGVLRVIALGASSTFGVWSLDDETYPHLLESFLQRQLTSRPCGRFRDAEVMNFGIPHLRSGEIRDLFVNEGLAFQPDIVTFYQGANDVRDWKRSWRSRLLFPARRKLLIVHFIAWATESWFSTFSSGDVAHQIAGKSQFFVENVSAIRQASAEHGAQFVAVTQQSTSFVGSDRERRGGVTYEGESALLREELAQGGRVDIWGLALLAHGELTAELRSWAVQQGVNLVDFIEVLDGRRDQLTTWVHLSAEGNRLLAEALGERILSLACDGRESAQSM